MFDVGFWELVLVALVTLIVVGPERLPGLARTAGAWLRRMRAFMQTVKDDIDREMEEGGEGASREFQDLKQEFSNLRQEFSRYSREAWNRRILEDEREQGEASGSGSGDATPQGSGEEAPESTRERPPESSASPGPEADPKPAGGEGESSPDRNTR
ncbi:MAG TPA: Sec-independent protein translocase protein TatB [Gammaproteobacteria bacterium]|nr:Sec-independent protein translocase protein TatB [Gammaproteobacteria bacterium]